MKMKQLSLAVVALATAALLGACASDGSSTDRGGVNPTDPVGIANRAMTALAYSPSGTGYPYKQTAPGSNVDSWVTDAAPQINNALSQVGDGYVLQVTGHTCTIGPRTAVGGKKGNVWYSTQRAQEIYNALARAGVPRDKMVVKGVASDQLLPGIPSDDQRQRRVSFQIIEK